MALDVTSASCSPHMHPDSMMLLNPFPGGKGIPKYFLLSYVGRTCDAVGTMYGIDRAIYTSGLHPI